MKRTAMKNLLAFTIILSAFVCRAQFSYTYTGKPRFQVLATQNNATLGIINIELFPRIAPLHVRNFDSLVSQKFYDTTAFHRVVPGFVIQGGDPNTRHGAVSTWGQGHPSQPKVKAEFSVAKHERGILSAARGNDINSATSQFFICVAPALFLDGSYSIYGRVTSGMNIVDAIVNTPTVFGTERPVNKVEMFVTYIGSNDSLPAPATLLTPRNDSVNSTAQSVILKWNHVPGAVYYRLEAAYDSLFILPFKSYDLTLLSRVINQLLPDTTYFWRVKANNGGHISTSPVWRFHTRELPVDETAVGEQKWDANMVYPSPATTYIQFRSQAGDRIEIFDALGKKVKSVDSEEGVTRVDVGLWVRGVYFYRVVSNHNSASAGKVVIE
jgi:peptidyl-prolyl cis-trans isomerase B (cyclophilin B)